VDADASEAFTVIEVRASDRPGLLFDLARAFASSAIDVHVAKVATFGPRVVDVFYVTEAATGKPVDPAALATLRETLMLAAAASPPWEPSSDPTVERPD
jgi:[protein-PII] uridylyltransferase